MSLSCLKMACSITHLDGFSQTAGNTLRESNTLLLLSAFYPVVGSNYREEGQAISNEHTVSGESINSSKIISTATREAWQEPINEGSCNWKPLLQTTFSLAISHYPSQRSASWCLLEADFKHCVKKPGAGSRISAKWALWRGSSSDHPKAPASEFQELMLSPKARYCSEA